MALGVLSFQCHFCYVMGNRKQAPFNFHFFDTPQQKATERPTPFDPAEGLFHFAASARSKGLPFRGAKGLSCFLFQFVQSMGDLNASSFAFFALFCISAAAAVLAAIDVPPRLITGIRGVFTAACMVQFSPIRTGITVAFCIIWHVICVEWVFLVFLCLFFVVGPVLDAAFTGVLFQVFVVLFAAVARVGYDRVR